jgi:hypothetical protein
MQASWFPGFPGTAADRLRFDPEHAARERRRPPPEGETLMFITRKALVLAQALAVAAGHVSGQSRDGWSTDFSRHTVPLEEIVPGGPPKDGIPALDRPRFVTSAAASAWLSENEPVMVVRVGEDVRAYPYRILIWHEIVNDRIGDVPVAVTYCPLCNTALAFDRRHAGRVLTFGVSGMLRHSDMVIFDRETESWWQQATGESIVGEFAGDRLRPVAAQTVSWAEFRRQYPRGPVLSQETGFERPYGRNPYAGYDSPRERPIRAFFSRTPDPRLPAMERVAAVQHAGKTVAYPFSELARIGAVNDRIGEDAVVVFWAAGTSSALDATEVSAGRDVGATGVFGRRVRGRDLTFAAVGDGRFRDRETGSTWTVLGVATEGELAGTRLEPIGHGDYLWFAWAVFQPETRIWRP